MQILNLRLKKKENTTLLLETWKKRVEFCQKRKLNDQEVESHNIKTSFFLKEILTPVAKRTKLPIVIEICEQETKVHIDFIYSTRTNNIYPRITLPFPSIYNICLNKTTLIDTTKKIESQIRLLRKTINITEPHRNEKSSTLSTHFPGSVFVKFSTRTRYF